MNIFWINFIADKIKSCILCRFLTDKGIIKLN